MIRSIQWSGAVRTLLAAMALAPAAPGALAQTVDQGLEEVQITGTRIKLSPGVYTPTPVTAVTQDELVKMAAELITLDVGNPILHCQAAKPLVADVVVSLLKLQSSPSALNLEQIRKVKKEPHVKRL